MEKNNHITENRSPVLCRLVSVLQLASDTLAMLGTEGFTDPNGSGINIPPEKIIGETAFLLLAASKSKDSEEVNTEIDNLAQRLLPFARDRKTAMNICLRPALALEYAQAHICLARLGYPDARFDDLLTEAMEGAVFQSKERPPHRMLEQAWIKRIWQPALFDAEAVLSATAFSAAAHTMDLIHGTTDDFYAFTHAMMYIRNFDDNPWPLPRSNETITGEAGSMLAHCLLTNDYDLAGELLLTWPLTQSRWTTSAAFVFNWLASSEESGGFLPMEKEHRKLYDTMEGENKKKYRYATGYHTVYVMGLLCATCLQQYQIPPDGLKNPVSGTGDYNKLICFLKEEEIKPGWLQAMEKLSGPAQDEIAGLLFDILLIQSARQKDYAKLYTLLRIGFELDLANRELAGQAAELLNRLALFADPATADSPAANQFSFAE